MKPTRSRNPLHLLFAVALGCVVCAGPVGAADIYLWAGATTVTMPDGTAVPMWGYALEQDGDFGTLEGTVTVPGPVLRLPPGDTSLSIHLYNTLPEPVSVVIPAQVGALIPETFIDGEGRERIRSFTTETPPGTIETYSWTDVRSGTYLYHSGTHPQVQVQMGLYGCLVRDVDVVGRGAIGEAYPGVLYDNEAVLVFSEIDPVLHTAVAAGDYGPGSPITSTIDYDPQYFLINGRPFPQAAPLLDHNISQGERLLVRLVNAGLRSHSPVFQGLTGDLVAEDGHPYPYPLRQHTVHLLAGKSQDMMVETPRARAFPVWDHSMGLTNGTQSPGGMVTYLVVSGAAGAPSALADTYVTDEDQQLVVTAPGVLVNDQDGGAPGTGPLVPALVDVPVFGTVNLAADGSFTYDPDPDFNGSDLFTYRVNDGTYDSDPASVVIQVTPVNDAPTATADLYTVDEDTVLQIPAPGVLANDQDVDGDELTAGLVAGPTRGTLVLGPDGAIQYTPDADYFGPDAFSYTAGDGLLSSAETAVQIDVVSVNDVPLTAADAGTTARESEVVVAVLANDADIDGSLVPATVSIATAPANGVAVANPDGTVSYTPAAGFTCQDTFTYTVADNEAGVSPETTVTVWVYGTASDDCFVDAGNLADILAGGGLPNCDTACLLGLIFQ